MCISSNGWLPLLTIRCTSEVGMHVCRWWWWQGGHATDFSQVGDTSVCKLYTPPIWVPIKIYVKHLYIRHLSWLLKTRHSNLTSKKTFQRMMAFFLRQANNESRNVKVKLQRLRQRRSQEAQWRGVGLVGCVATLAPWRGLSQFAEWRMRFFWPWST